MKSTKELIHRLKTMDKSNLNILADKDFKCPRIQYYLANLLREHELSPTAFISEMNLERSYGYQMLNGNRKPSREVLIKTAILLRLNLDETQRLLKIGKRSVLYPRIKNDAIAIFSLEKGLSLQEYQELLTAHGEGFDKK